MVVGAGAAGLMAAIHAAEALKGASPRSAVVVFDARAKIGAKILISGGTRCNVTNLEVTPSDYNGGPSHFTRHILEAFTPAETIRFFELIGVALVLEPTGKYFPTTHSGRTVLDALTSALKNTGALLETGVRVSRVTKHGEGFELILDTAEGKRPVFTVRRVILATGGLSYPETGSDGTGLKIAESLGHRVVKTAPALTPLVTEDREWPTLSGMTVETELSFYADGKKRASTRGSMLFTHAGFSGPAALDLSRHWTCSESRDKKVEAHFFEVPKRLAQLLHKKGLNSKRPLHCDLNVTGVLGYKKAEVTAGGVDLKEVTVGTMQSKLVPGLYFAGEILNTDGRIGGFNFQWAWSTGALAGRAAAKSLAT